MNDLILGVDVGNTHTVFGLFDNSSGFEIIRDWRTHTRRERTSDELGIFLYGFLQSSKIDVERIRGFIYSSVVPSFNLALEKAAKEYFNCDPICVTHEIVPLTVSYPRTYEIGADRLVNAVAADSIYGGDIIVIDMGTATTFCVISDGNYIGGAIAPGLNVSIESLAKNTAQLPPVKFERPPGGVIGDTTTRALQSGFYYGWIGMLQNIKKEIQKTGAEKHYKTIGTGGLSSILYREGNEGNNIFDEVDTHLTLRGLKIIYKHVIDSGKMSNKRNK